MDSTARVEARWPVARWHRQTGHRWWEKCARWTPQSVAYESSGRIHLWIAKITHRELAHVHSEIVYRLDRFDLRTKPYLAFLHRGGARSPHLFAYSYDEA